MHLKSLKRANAAQLNKSTAYRKPMEDIFEVDLQRFDEDETIRRREFFLADTNLYVYRRNPELQECEVIPAQKGSKSVLDICGVRVKTTLRNGKNEKYFVCLQGKCF